MTQQQSTKRSADWNLARKLGVLSTAIGLACLSSAALAQSVNDRSIPSQNTTKALAESGIAPAANTTVGNARVIVPDGTSLGQSHAASETRWFAFGAEPGKTYAVEVLDPYGDLNFNGVSIGIFNSDGTTTPTEAFTTCGRSAVAPALEAQGPALDGARCIVRTYYPDAFTTLNRRSIYISVDSNYASSFQIRVREATLYSRWTTNGYDFHVEVQNTSTDPVCVELDFYPGTGTPGPTGTIFATVLNVPAKGALKYVRPNGSTVNGDNKGTLRIHDCGNGQLVPGVVQLNTYAYNPVTNLFIPFSNGTVNNGSTGNTW